MFTPSSLTVSKTMWLTLKHARHKNTCFILLYSFCVRQFLVQIVLDVHSHRSSVMCQLLFHLNKHWNISNSPIKKFHENLYRGLSSYMQTHTNRHSEAKRHTVTKFHYKYAKKIIGSFLEMLPGIIFSGGTIEVYATRP